MDFDFLAQTTIFQNIPANEVKKMLHCLDANVKHYKKDDTIYFAGDHVQSLGMLLTGSATVENNDIWGNRTIMNHLSAGNIFAESYACTPNFPLMVNVIASEATEVLFLNIRNVMTTCPDTCSCHKQLISNLLMVLAMKNLNLSNHIFCTSSKTIRGRLISYLSYLSAQQKSLNVTTPFNRQQLADYLGVDRSAMSNELSKMQKNELLTYHKNSFHLIRISDDFA